MLFYLLYSVHHVPSMHHSSSVHFDCCTLPPSTRINPSQQQHPSLLCSVYLYYLCTFFVLHCIVPLHSLQRTTVLFIGLFTATSIFSLLRSLKHQHTLFVLHVLLVSSPLPHHHRNSSSFLVVMPMRSSSLGVMLRFLSLSSSRDSLSSLSQSSSSSLLQLQASTLFHLSIASMNSLHSTGKFLENLQLL
jgi:hypothetical protein